MPRRVRSRFFCTSEFTRRATDVRAICRTHAPFASAWPVGGKAPEIQHGFGGIVGDVATFDECDLIHNAEIGARAAKALGGADALMLRGNGVLTVGRTLGEAAARMWSFEERCAQAARQGAHQAPFSAEDLAARARWYPAEAERIWNWLKYLGSSECRPGNDGVSAKRSALSRRRFVHDALAAVGGMTLAGVSGSLARNTFGADTAEFSGDLAE